MSKILRKRSNKVGLPPGSLVHIGNIDQDKINISVMDYDANHVIEKNNATEKECLIFLDNPSITWINIDGISDLKMVETIGAHFGLHPLLLEDIVNSGQRSKLDDYRENIFIVVRTLKHNAIKDEIEDEQVSLILGKNYLISFTENRKDIFDPIVERIRNKNSRITHLGSDYLCYCLIDCIVDNYFVILEKVDEKLEKLEKGLFQDPQPKTLQQIQSNKRDILFLRKSVWPIREVVNHFRRLENPIVKDSTKLYMQDVYDHTIQAIDTIESFRDVSSGLLDIYLSSINLRMNEIMKVLTIMATIFVPLTFIASLYGMNFEHIPELQFKYGYYVVLFIMLLMSLGMLYFFRRKGWI